MHKHNIDHYITLYAVSRLVYYVVFETRTQSLSGTYRTVCYLRILLYYACAYYYIIPVHTTILYLRITKCNSVFSSPHNLQRPVHIALADTSLAFLARAVPRCLHLDLAEVLKSQCLRHALD